MPWLTTGPTVLTNDLLQTDQWRPWPPRGHTWKADEYSIEILLRPPDKSPKTGIPSPLSLSLFLRSMLEPFFPLSVKVHISLFLVY